MLPAYLVYLSKDEINKPYIQRLPCSILFQPHSRKKPAVIYLHGWNQYPYCLQACSLGSALGNLGYLFLSLGIHRRGVEGQMRAIPDEDIKDIHLGMEYLSSHGCSEIIIIGEEIGALSAIRYQSKKRDSRVKGIVLINPILDLPNWLENILGKTRYQALEQQSGNDVIEGNEGEKWVDLRVNNVNNQLLIYQSFDSWLAWWGSNADTKIPDFLTNLPTPCLQLNHKQNNKQNNKQKVQVEQIDSWINQLQLVNNNQFQLVKEDVSQPAEIVTVKTSNGSSLVGFLWQGEDDQANQTVVLHVRGKTGTPITEPLFTTLAEVYNQNHLASLVIELRRSGYGGNMEATASMDVEDIHSFVELLSQRGYTRIILSGQSFGSNSIMRYQAQQHHPLVKALVHMAPTQDCANWLKQHLGSHIYNRFLEEAQKAMEESRGEQGLIGKPPYDNMLSPQRPHSWISWWGSQANTANLKTIAEIDIPILLLCGSKDFFNDRDRLNQLQKAASRSPITDIIWYEGCGHNFANFEQKAAEDIVNWLQKVIND